MNKKLMVLIIVLCLSSFTYAFQGEVLNYTFSDGSWTTDFDITSTGSYSTDAGYLKLLTNNNVIVYDDILGKGSDFEVCIRITKDVSGTPRCGGGYYQASPGMGETSMDSSNMFSTTNGEIWSEMPDTCSAGASSRQYKVSGKQNAGTGIDGWNVHCIRWSNETGTPRMTNFLNGVEVINNSFSDVYGDYYSGGHNYGGVQPDYSTGFKFGIRHTAASNDNTWIDYISFKNLSYVPPVVTGDYPYENVNFIEQDSDVIITSTTFVDVIATTLNRSQTTSGYASVFGNLEATGNPQPDMYCCLRVNDVCVNANVTYVNPTQNQEYAFYGTSEIFNLTSGNNDIHFECRGSNNKEFIVSNTIITAFEFFDTNDYNFTYFNRDVNFSVNSPASYSVVSNFPQSVPYYNYTGSTKSTYVIYDTKLSLDYPITNTAYGYLQIDDLSCAPSQRYGLAGQLGSGNFICAKKLNDTQTTVNFTSYGQGVFDVQARGVIKFLSLEDYEFNLTEVYNFTFNESSNWTTVYSTNHTIDTFGKGIVGMASLSALSNTGSIETIYRFSLENENGSVIYRDFLNSNESGLIALNYAFTNLVTGNYTLSFEVFLNSTTPEEAEIVSANFISYVGGATDITPNTFTITALDVVLGTNVQSFTMSDGITLSTTTGTIEYPVQDDPINLTFSAFNYINQTTYNWNTSLNLQLNVSPYPWINFTAYYPINGTFITGFSIDCNNQGSQLSGANNYLLYQLNANITNTTCYFDHPDFARIDFNVTGINAAVLNTYQVTAYTTNSYLFHIYNISNYEYVNRTTTVTFYSEDTGQSFSVNTTNGTLYIDLIVPDDYLVEFSNERYEKEFVNLELIDNSFTEKNIYLKPLNALQVTYNVVNQKSNPVDQVTVKVQQFDGSNWVFVSECTTNSEGTCNLYIENVDDVVRYSLFYQGDLVLSTKNEIVDYNTRNFVIVVGLDFFNNEDYYNRIKSAYFYDISPDSIKIARDNNITDWNFSLNAQWNYPQVSQVCMKLTSLNNNSELFDSCIDYSSQAQIYERHYELANVTYLFETYAIIEGETRILDTVIIDLRTNKSIYGNMGLFLTLLLFSSVTIIGAKVGNVGGASIGGATALTICSIVGWYALTPISLGSIWLLAFVVAVGGTR